ncbi:MAG: transposase, partial [Spirochaetes bacterium]|nr:transposase [Spirochaetota bacterium]
MYYTAYNPYFRTNHRAGHCTAAKLFCATDFIAELLQHLPDYRSRVIRRYGLYSFFQISRHLAAHAPPRALGPRGVEA